MIYFFESTRDSLYLQYITTGHISESRSQEDENLVVATTTKMMHMILLMTTSILLGLPLKGVTAFFIPSVGRTTTSGTKNMRRATFLQARDTDTPTTLPEFSSREEYMKYMEPLSGLPKGFATGTANGKFISVEAPSMGPLPIRGTIIHLTEGPTDNWAAVFTKNKVSVCTSSQQGSRRNK